MKIETVSDVKVAVMNFSGNVGKTTICNALLIPRIEDAEVFRIETINSDGSSEAEKISAHEYGSLLRSIEMADSCVIDVGSSNIEVFISKMFAFKNSHEEIDYIIIPVTPDSKQIDDTISVYEFLIEKGVDSSKIKVILNRVERNIYSPNKELDYFKNSILAQFFDIDSLPVVYESEYYSALNLDSRTHLEIINDDRDFKELKKSAKSKDEKWKIVQEKTLHRAALSAEDDLAKAFAVLDLG